MNAEGRERASKLAWKVIHSYFHADSSAASPTSEKLVDIGIALARYVEHLEKALVDAEERERRLREALEESGE
jgi:hypothetical protein